MSMATARRKVSFSEMQALENESGNVAYVALRKLLYLALRAMETGGVMADIRTLTVDRFGSTTRIITDQTICSLS